MTHCANGNCAWCRRQRQKAQDERTAETERKAKAAGFRFWDTKLPQGVGVIAWWPRDVFGFAINAPHRLQTFVRRA